MSNNLNHSPYSDDQVDFKRIFKILIESKKLIISTIFIFTTASIIYSLSLKPSYISSIQMEIGYFEIPNGTQKLIETPSDLISDLRLLKLRNPNKFSQNVSMNSLEGRVIKLDTNSSSIEQNENLLTEIISLIDERHSNFALLTNNRKKDKLTREIELIEYEISILKKNMQLDLESKILDLEGKILRLEAILPSLDEEITQLEQVIIDDSNNLKLIKTSNFVLERASRSPTLEQVISSYKSKIYLLKRERNSSMLEISILSQKLDNLKTATSQSDELFRLEQKLKNTENELQMLITQTLVKTQPIGNIKTNEIKPKTQLMIFLGIIFGFLTGIFLVFMRNFVNSYKESQA